MNFLQILEKHIIEIIKNYCSEKENSDLLKKITVKYAYHLQNADIYTNAAIIGGKIIERDYKELAIKIISSCQNLFEIDKIFIMRSGFISFNFSPFFWQKELKKVFLLYGKNQISQKNKRQNIFYNNNSISFTPSQPTDENISTFIQLYESYKKSAKGNWEKYNHQSRINHYFCIQYAYTRIQSVLHYAKEYSIVIEIKELKKINLEFLIDDKEIVLIKLLVEWFAQLDIADETVKSNKILKFLYRIAVSFDNLWITRKGNAHLRFIDLINKRNTEVRLTLISIIANVFEEGLSLCGITLMQEMQ